MIRKETVGACERIVAIYARHKGRDLFHGA